jgi:hypothetical protein
METGKEKETVGECRRVQAGRYKLVQPDQVGDGPKCDSGAPDVQNEIFSLQNRLKLGRCPMAKFQQTRVSAGKTLENGCPPAKSPHFACPPANFAFDKLFT